MKSKKNELKVVRAGAKEDCLPIMIMNSSQTTVKVSRKGDFVKIISYCLEHGYKTRTVFVRKASLFRLG